MALIARHPAVTSLKWKEAPMIEECSRAKCRLIMAAFAVLRHAARMDILVARDAVLFHAKKGVLSWLVGEKWEDDIRTSFVFVAGGARLLGVFASQLKVDVWVCESSWALSPPGRRVHEKHF